MSSCWCSLEIWGSSLFLTHLNVGFTDVLHIQCGKIFMVHHMSSSSWIFLSTHFCACSNFWIILVHTRTALSTEYSEYAYQKSSEYAQLNYSGFCLFLNILVFASIFQLLTLNILKFNWWGTMMLILRILRLNIFGLCWRHLHIEAFGNWTPLIY